MVRAVPVLLILMLDVFCVIDIIGSPAERVRGLPKIAWLLLVLVFTPIGALAWLIAGRPQGSGAGRSSHEPQARGFPEYDRPGRASGVTPESDEEFLRRVRERAEEQRRKAAEDKKRREAGEGDQDRPGPGTP